MAFKPIDLDVLIEQRAEALGTDEGRVPFTFKGGTFTFRHPDTLTDEEQLEVADLEVGPDVAEFYMGGDEYERFVEAGGSANFWALVFVEFTRQLNEQTAGGKGRSKTSRKKVGGWRR